MRNSKDILILLSVLIFIAIDQLVKYVIRQGEGFYICNHGIAFGIKISELFFWTLVAFIFFWIFYFFKNGNNFSVIKKYKYGVVLMLSGAISNIIDRIIFGCVVDFIDIKIINYPLFNLADSFIFIGTILIFWKILKLKM